MTEGSEFYRILYGNQELKASRAGARARPRARAREGRQIPAHPSFADAAEIKLPAQRRIGEISKTLEKALHGGAGDGSKIPPLGISKRDTLKSAGLSASAANRATRAVIRPGAA